MTPWAALFLGLTTLLLSTGGATAGASAAPTTISTAARAPSSTAAPGAVSVPSQTTAPADSSRPISLPFRPLSGPGDRFSISRLTEPYETDLTPFLSLEGMSPVDLDVLDRHGYFPEFDVPVDSAGTHRLFREREPRRVAELTPEEKEELVPPQPGVTAGIPSAVAVTGTLLGGLGLLLKVLSDIF
ncbi:MAG: hypothetical protein ACE5G2_11310 [Candidatus Krumholzibacteriia bacterium]